MALDSLNTIVKCLHDWPQSYHEGSVEKYFLLFCLESQALVIAAR